MPHTEHVPIILKKSSVPGKIPVESDLQYGELALNYSDGVLRFKNDTNEVTAFPQAKKLLTPAWAPAITIDLLNGRVDVVRLTLEGDTELTFTNPKDDQKFILELTQDSTGDRSYTWTNDVRMTDAVSRGLAPSTTPGLMDKLGFHFRIDKFYLMAIAFGFPTT